MPAVDKQIQALLTRLAGAAAKTGGARPYLLADHLALQRIGPATLSAVKDLGVTYVDNPATNWVLASFRNYGSKDSAGQEPAEQASQVVAELNKLNKAVDDKLKETQAGIAERIDKRISSSGPDPAASQWVETFRSAWDKEQPMNITGDLDFDGYPDSPASPSPKRYLNSFMSLIDSLPSDAEVVLLSGSAAILHHVDQWTDEDSNVHTVMVSKDEVTPLND